LFGFGIITRYDWRVNGSPANVNCRNPELADGSARECGTLRARNRAPHADACQIFQGKRLLQQAGRVSAPGGSNEVVRSRHLNQSRKHFRKCNKH